jgi:mono/diheme cytochrome c family protein
MRKFFKVTGYTVGVILFLALAAITYFNLTYPKVEAAPDLKVEITPARLARGEYLVKHVVGCLDCHSERDWTKYAGPVIPGTEGKGGESLDKETAGVPGTVYAYDITPAGIGNWTDGELIRAITCGVDMKGKAIFPIMPYYHFNTLDTEDIYSIVAYIRSLKPIKNTIPARSLDFPLNLLVKTMPIESYHPSARPDTTNLVAYGEYLANAAACVDCHTEMVKGEPVAGMDYAGGFRFGMPGGIVKSANITPDSATGIGKWTSADFINYFKTYRTESGRNIPVSPKAFNTPMPLTSLAGMTDYDLGAIYAYLRTVKPVHNEVTRFTPDK